MGIAVRNISIINGARHLGNTEMVGQKMEEVSMTIQATMKAQLYVHSVDAKVDTFIFNAIFQLE